MADATGRANLPADGAAGAGAGPRDGEVPAQKRNRFGRLQARYVSVDAERLHILVRKPEGGTKAYDMISRVRASGRAGSPVALSIACREVEGDRPKRLVLLFGSAAEARAARELCERSSVTRDTKPYKLYAKEYRQQAAPLGSGHFAKVFLAHHRASGLPCAAKVVNKKGLSSAESRNLLNEIAIMRMLVHPHIVRLFAVFEDERHLVLCEELCAGGELFDRIVSKKKYSEKLAREVCKLVVQTVTYVHSRSVVHLDLKPENLLLVGADSDLDVKVTDWGLAQVIADGERLHRQCGTPGYTAPEVLAGERANPSGYGTQADVWSLGVITYILLCGYPPYSLLPNATFAEELRVVTAAPPTFEPEDWGPISRHARDFVLRMLVVDPARRWTAARLLTHPWMTAADVRDDHLLRAAKCAPRRARRARAPMADPPAARSRAGAHPTPQEIQALQRRAQAAQHRAHDHRDQPAQAAAALERPPARAQPAQAAANLESHEPRGAPGARAVTEARLGRAHAQIIDRFRGDARLTSS